MNLRLDWCSHEAAKYAVENWHYSKTMPVPPIIKIGVWENAKFIGVVLFSRGASSNLYKPYNITHYQGCELTRVALNKHISPVTRIIKIAIKMLKKTNPELRIIVSFADPHYNHTGGIYQAGNWLYAGKTAKSKEYWHNGKRWHTRQISEKGWNIQQGQVRKTLKPSMCKVVETPEKYRYLMPLDDEMRKQIEPLRQPYPKRPKQATSPVQGDSGGAAPTRTLQNISR